jgi:hypothetical protein
MSNTWDTVFEEGLSSVPVCNNCTIICSLVWQVLTCHFVCYVPVFCYFKYCCIHLVVYLCDVLVNFLYFVKLSFCLFGFVSFFFSSKLLQAFLIKGILRPSHGVLFAALFQLEPSPFAFRTFFRQKKITT